MFSASSLLGRTATSSSARLLSADRARQAAVAQAKATHSAAQR
jgi:hypothetical protein